MMVFLSMRELGDALLFEYGHDRIRAIYGTVEPIDVGFIGLERQDIKPNGQII